MILIVGARGRLGGLIARQLLAAGKPVRAMSRAPEKVESLRSLGAEIVAGDLRDPTSCVNACRGVEQIVTAAHAFDGTGGNTPRAVDDEGNRHLIDAARQSSVQRIMFTSIMGVRPDHPVDVFRYKYRTEQYLRGSGLPYTILRPSAFMELWATILGEPIVKRNQALIFGRGINPINFVSAADVTHVALAALSNEQAIGQTIEIGGPENLSLVQVADTIERATGRAAKKRYIPLPMMRVMRPLTLPFNSAFSRQIATGIYMDTHDMTFDPAATLARYPLRLTRMEEVVRRLYSPRPI